MYLAHPKRIQSNDFFNEISPKLSLKGDGQFHSDAKGIAARICDTKLGKGDLC